MGTKLLGGIVLLIFGCVVAVILVCTGHTSDVADVYAKALNTRGLRRLSSVASEYPAAGSATSASTFDQEKSATVADNQPTTVAEEEPARWSERKRSTLAEEEQPLTAAEDEVHNTVQEQPSEHIFVQNDTSHFRLHHEGSSLPRVLIYTWCTEDTYALFLNEVYWKCCYAHAHGFDVVFSDKKNFTGVAQYDHDESAGQKDANADVKLKGWYTEENMWALWDDIRPYLFGGKYDYVFMMGADVLILENWLHWPVWAYDTGHDITVMDQHHFPFWFSYGLNENNVLFKNSEFAREFIDFIWEYRKGFHLQGDNGPYMDTILEFLGREAEAQGRPGYDKKCFKHLKLEKPSILNFKEPWWPKMNDAYEECFFNEVDRLAGRFGYRESAHIGFYPNFLEFPKGTAYFPTDLRENDIHVPPTHFHSAALPLGPWVNCWSSVRAWWPEPEKNCFANHWNGPKDPNMLGKVRGQCPDPSFNWEVSPYNPVNRPPPS